ncbi:MAG: hypothetical protein IKD37_02290 [Clostridia bacterium]|nr:hypothetical protein [Clostridia bacterium]
MQLLIQSEQPRAVLAEAVCTEKGQVLFAYAAPFGLDMGDHLRDCLCRADRALPEMLFPGQAALARTKSGRPMLILRGAAGIDALLLVRESRCTTAALAAAAAHAYADVMLLPELPDAPEAMPAPTEIEAAYVELTALFAHRPMFGGRHAASLERSLQQIVALPPLADREVRIDLRTVDTELPSRNFAGVFYALSSFLCRCTGGSALDAALFGDGDMIALILKAEMPRPVAPGRCGLSILAAHFPMAAELMLCKALAEQEGFAIEAFAENTQMIGFTCRLWRGDPAVYGLKKPIGFSDAAEEARAAEWCRLLRDAVLRSE